MRSLLNTLSARLLVGSAIPLVLFVAVGLDRVELLPRPWTHAQPMVTIDRDVPAGLHRLREHVKDIHWDLDAVRARVALQRRALIGAGPTLTPGRVVQTVAAAAPSARVTVDAGAHMFPATWLWRVAEPGGMLISNGLSTMGAPVPRP